MSANCAIRILSWPEALQHARPVRYEVFVMEQAVPVDLEWDDWDERSDHAIAFDADGRAIGTARLLPEGRIGRMAVRAQWRRQGVGGALLEAMLAQALYRGMTQVSLHAQAHAAGFYRRFGFSERGAEFSEAGIPHLEITLELAALFGAK